MTTLRVDYLVKYSDDVETVYYKIKGQAPRFDARDTATIVVSSEGAELLLMTGTFRSAVFMDDDDADIPKDAGTTDRVDVNTINIYNTGDVDPREVTLRQNERLW